MSNRLDNSRSVVVSYTRKYVHKVLVSRLFKLAQACPGKSVVRLTDHLDMTVTVYWDVKQQNKQKTKQIESRSGFKLF